MTRMPDDPIDPYEPALARRVQDYTEQAVVPIDAAAIAASVARERPRVRAGVFGTARLGWVVAAGAVALMTVGVLVFGAGSRGPLAGTDSSASPGAGPVGPVGSGEIGVCDPTVLQARVTRWEGAAGHRIATVTIRNLSQVACLLPRHQQVQLVDGSRKALINGTAPTDTGTITLGAVGELEAMVDASNYCGGRAQAPVSVALVMPSGDRLIAIPVSPTDVNGVPPCNGPSQPGQIEMQPWQ